MKKIIVSIIFLLCSFLLSITLDAQPYYPYSEPNAPLTGKILDKFIEDSAKYHNTRAVYEGFPYKYCLPHTCVNRMGKYALVGYNHRPITKFEFDRLYGDWKNNIFIAKINQLFGCIDTTGKIIVPVSYPELYINELPLIITSKDPKTAKVLNAQGKQILPNGYQYVGNLDLGSQVLLNTRNENQDSIILFDRNGKKIRGIKGFNINCLNFSTRNTYSVKTSASFYDGMVVVDSNFMEIARTDFYQISWANDVWVYGNRTQSRKQQLYNILEKKYYPLEYDNITPLKSNSSLIGTDFELGKSVILDKNLQVIVPPQFHSLAQIGDKNVFIVSTFSDKVGLIDGQGKIILDTVCNYIREIPIPVPTGGSENTPQLLTKLEFTDFLNVRIDEKETIFHIGEKSFIKGEVIVLTPDIYYWKPDATSARLKHRDGRIISEVYKYWTTDRLMTAIQKDKDKEVVQIYDKKGQLLREVEGKPKAKLMSGYNEMYSWQLKNGKFGIFDGNLHPVVEPQYDNIYSLEEIPKEFACILLKYGYPHQKNPFLGWVWNNGKTMPLLIKENGELVNIVKLE